MKTTLTFLTLFAFSMILNASELFIKVNSQGKFYASCGLMSQNNNNSTFRFFDLNQGMTNVSIYSTENNSLFYSGSINLEYNNRLICEIDNFGQLSVIKKELISYSNWYTSTSSNIIIANNGNTNFGNEDSGFQAFLKLLNDESFDSGKLEKAKKYISKTTLSSSQIAEINSKFSFDSTKLEWAKYAYTYCYDKQNYFLLKPTFSFSLTYNSLEDYIEGK